MFCLKSVQSVRAFRTCATRLRGGKTLSMAATQGATKGPVIGTHDGTFHCDEVLGVAMLRKLPEWSAAEVKRTRDEEELKGCDAVLDVGAEYDPRRMRFDHHQSSFSECFSEEHGTKLSSAGLIYRHFGTRIVAQVLGWDTDDASTVEVFRKVYRSFIEFVDANDNGIPQFDTDKLPRYENNTHIAARIGDLNPAWNQDQSRDAQYRCFHRAMELAFSEFEGAIQKAATIWLPARSIVKGALDAKMRVHPSGEVFTLEGGGVPWKDHLAELEEERGEQGLHKFALYPDERDYWRVQAVPVHPHSFECRTPLPEAWRGLRGEELSAEAGIPGCVFAHRSGFIGANETYRGALSMALSTLGLE